MPKKLTYEYVKEYIESNYKGSKLLSTEYVNAKEKLIIKCPNNHEFKINFSDFKSGGYRCAHCAGNAPPTPEYIESEFERRGYEIVSGIYKNAQSKFKYICSDHIDVIQEISWNAFQQGKGCKYCGIESMKKLQCLDKESIETEFTSRNLRIIDINEYVNVYSEMHFECNKHKDIVQKTKFSTLKVSKYGCKFCAKENNVSSLKYNIRLADKAFDDYGFILLDKAYKNSASKMNFLCKKHPNIIQQVSLSSVLSGEARCKECSHENRIGENSNNWNGGVTRLRKYVREKLTGWVSDSLKHYNYTCVITGHRGYLNVHHIYPFHKILSETMEVTKLPVYSEVRRYSPKELALIDRTSLKLHYKYGYGIPLHPKIHKLFHKIYGKNDFNLNNLVSFIDRLHLHEFDDYLNKHNLSLVNKQNIANLLPHYKQCASL